MRTSEMILACGTFILLLSGCCEKREITKRSEIQDDFKKIWNAINLYADDHLEKMPFSLGELYPKYLVDKNALVGENLPLVTEAEPPTTYNYAPCSYTGHSDTIIVYVNFRDRHPQGGGAVLTLGGAIQYLEAHEFEKAIKGL